MRIAATFVDSPTPASAVATRKTLIPFRVDAAAGEMSPVEAMPATSRNPTRNHGTSFSSHPAVMRCPRPSRRASTTAIADAPQMPVPTPMRVRMSRSMRIARPMSNAPSRHTASETSMTGSDSAPTVTMLWSDSCDPSSTTASCSTNLLEYVTPGEMRVSGRRTSEIATPMTTAGIADPTSGTNRPIAAAAAAISTQTASPGQISRPRPTSRFGNVATGLTCMTFRMSRTPHRRPRQCRTGPLRTTGKTPDPRSSSQTGGRSLCARGGT